MVAGAPVNLIMAQKLPYRRLSSLSQTNEGLQQNLWGKWGKDSARHG
jgi:hypothetical protein